MAVIDDKPVWEAKITQIDPNDPVQGGAGGVERVIGRGHLGLLKGGGREGR